MVLSLTTKIVHESDEFSDVVYSLANHPFMNKLVTPTQRKNGTDRDLIIQTFMFMLTNQGNDFTSFRTKDIDAFVRDYSDIALEKSDVLKDSMDKLDAAFEEIKIPVTSIPMVLYSSYRVTKNKESFSKLVDIINDFLTSYETNDEYKQFVMSGTSSSDNVKGRFNWWRNKIKTA